MFMRVKHFTTKNQHIHTYKCVSGSCQSGAHKKFINHPEASTKKSSARHKKFTHEHFKNFFFFIFAEQNVKVLRCKKCGSAGRARVRRFYSFIIHYALNSCTSATANDPICACECARVCVTNFMFDNFIADANLSPH